MTPSFASLLGADGEAYTVSPIVSGPLLYYDDQSGVIFDGQKFIRGNLLQQHELFDLEADAGELRSRTAQDPGGAVKGQRLLQEAEVDSATVRETLGFGAGEASELDAQKLDMLNSMGYLN